MPEDGNLDRHIALRIADERRVITLLNGSMRKTENPVIRLLLTQLALDSTKHEHMLKIILELLKPSPDSRLEVDDEDFREAMEKHVRLEREMVDDFQKLVERIDDKRIRFILQDIISDEKRHHAITKRIYDLVYKSGATKDEVWWDFLFRYSRLSG